MGGFLLCEAKVAHARRGFVVGERAPFEARRNRGGETEAMTQAARVSSGSNVTGGYSAGRVGLRGPATPSQGQVEGLKSHNGPQLNDAEYQFQFIEQKGEERAAGDKNSRRRSGILFQTPSATFAAILGAIDEHEGAHGGVDARGVKSFGRLLTRAISAYEKTAHVIGMATARPTHTVRISL